MKRGQSMTLRRRMEREWAKRVYGPRWRRAFKRRQRPGNGTFQHGLAAYRAGWVDCGEAILHAMRKQGTEPLP